MAGVDSITLQEQLSNVREWSLISGYERSQELIVDLLQIPDSCLVELHAVLGPNLLHFWQCDAARVASLHEIIVQCNGCCLAPPFIALGCCY